MQVRQGDVFIERVKNIEVGSMKPLPREGGCIILARGEATGHAHAIADPDVEMYQDGNGNVFIRVPSVATITHQEHAPIRLQPGDYEVIRQREYHPSEIRRVAD